ncbi:MAG: hypothetical protein B6U73_05055 [Desulfurococcales archaeon ex4484_204]|nr:MAG: hypothetical protein B6U73_05055 [Desulfurococcales archaeon ex4484_204]
MWVWFVPRVVVSIPYEVLERVVKAYQGLPPEEAVRLFIMDSLGGEEKVKELQARAATISREDMARLHRSIMDLLNPYTAKLDNMARKLATVIELLESVAERLSVLDSVASELKQLRASMGPQQVGRPTPREGRERVRRHAVDILREQKVMFESDIASKIKNRDAFFERLRRDGAVVLELVDERVAVDPSFWAEFKSRLTSLRTNSEGEVAKALGKEGLALLKALMKSAQAYFDVTRKEWVLMIGEEG